MGTVAGVNTRRYHGLLIASLNPPADRYSIFPRIEETVELAGQLFNLGAVQYPGVVSPAGYTFLEAFSDSPSPTWHYRCGDCVIKKSLRLLDGQQSVLVSYVAGATCKIAIRLFISFRDYHSVTRRNSSLNPQVTEQADRLKLQPYENLPPLTVHHNAANFEPDSAWFHNHEYLRELERGLDFREDLYSPGILHFELETDKQIYLLATLESSATIDNSPQQTFASPLTRALDQFRVIRADKRPTLIAGYPWFTDWSRDTLISLPALMAAGFPPNETRSILEFLLAERKQGILPNRFSDKGSAPEYNTVDASLWFFIAAHSYVNATQDRAFVESTLLPAALDIIHWHTRGTFYGIQVDASDHLLAAGVEGTQLTWMDAKIGDYVVTPRIGKPVEINALWFNALNIASRWATLVGKAEIAQQLLAESEEVRNSFESKFCNPARECLYDVLSPSGPDASLRPNQLFALSLPHPLLNRIKAQSIIEVVRRNLLTPAGLRTLDPADPRYCPRFAGDMHARDSAYHQGTVWPWLIGPFIHAYLYAFDNSNEAKHYCGSIADSALQLLNNYCLGSIGEVNDAEPPYHPGGCPAQLWSVAQIVLALQTLGKI
jgi:glycogen debranching enzyme